MKTVEEVIAELKSHTVSTEEITSNKHCESLVMECEPESLDFDSIKSELASSGITAEFKDVESDRFKADLTW